MNRAMVTTLLAGFAVACTDPSRTGLPLLVNDFPREPVRLLWFAGRRATWDGLERRAAVLDQHGRPVLFDERLLPIRVPYPRSRLRSAGDVIGPDGMIYELRVAGDTADGHRLIVRDPGPDTLVRVFELPARLPTLAVAATGRVYLLDAVTALTGTTPENRPRQPTFALERLRGGRDSLAAYRGRVTLLNVWASWCGPCREELPELVSLYREFADESRFAMLTLNEDIRRRDGERFLVNMNLDPPVGFGDGRLRRRFRYFGLPYTVLVDAEGRMLYRWTGYGGGPQLDAIRAIIVAELERTAS